MKKKSFKVRYKEEFGNLLCYSILTDNAWSKYMKIIDFVCVEYDKIQRLASAEYKKKISESFWKLAMKKENRVKEWK